jgi:hypothetical protein
MANADKDLESPLVLPSLIMALNKKRPSSFDLSNQDLKRLRLTAMAEIGTPRVSLTDLPNEILDMIVSNLSDESKSLRLVSRRFADLCDPYLYGELQVGPPDNKSGQLYPTVFQAARRFLSRPDLARTVRTLVIVRVTSHDNLSPERSQLLGLEAEMIDHSFEPDLPNMLRNGMLVAPYLLLLHILQNLHVLYLNAWGTNHGSLSLADYLMERVNTANGNISLFHASLPDGLHGVSRFYYDHWKGPNDDFEITIARNIVLPAYLLPEIESVKVIAYDGDGNNQILERWQGMSSVRKMKFTSSNLPLLEMRGYINMCPSLERFTLEIGAPGSRYRTATPSEIVQALHGVSQSLTNLSLLDEYQIEEDEFKDDIEDWFIGPLQEFTALKKLKLFSYSLVPRGDDDLEDTDWKRPSLHLPVPWNEILPHSLQKLTINSLGLSEAQFRGLLEMRKSGLLPRLETIGGKIEADSSGVIRAIEALGIDMSSIRYRTLLTLAVVQSLTSSSNSPIFSLTARRTWQIQ